MKYILYYLLIVNALAFLLMLIDKEKAKKRKWRIPEATLMGFAAIGGSLGILMGMNTFRHKTLHRKFTLGVPVILVAQVVAAVILVYWFYL